MSDAESIGVPCSSMVEEDRSVQEHGCSEISKLQLKDAVVYYEHLLAINDLVALESSPKMSQEAMQLGEDIYNS